MSYYLDYNKLVEEIKPYWLGRGWKLQTLLNKSNRELLGIRQTMYKQLAKQEAKEKEMAKVKATIVTKPKEIIPEQLSLFDIDTEPLIKKNAHRRITLID